MRKHDLLDNSATTKPYPEALETYMQVASKNCRKIHLAYQAWGEFAQHEFLDASLGQQICKI